jgi:hypothetical protein
MNQDSQGDMDKGKNEVEATESGPLYQPAETNLNKSSYVGKEVGAKTISSPTINTVTWEASEYIEHAKGPLWIVGLCVVALALLGLAFLVRSWTFGLLVVVSAVGVGILAFTHSITKALRSKINFIAFAIFELSGSLGTGPSIRPRCCRLNVSCLL